MQFTLNSKNPPSVQLAIDIASLSKYDTQLEDDEQNCYNSDCLSCYLDDRQNYRGTVNPLMSAIKLQSNGSLYSNTVICTLAFDGWTITFGTARRGMGGL